MAPRAERCSSVEASDTDPTDPMDPVDPMGSDVGCVQTCPDFIVFIHLFGEELGHGGIAHSQETSRSSRGAEMEHERGNTSGSGSLLNRSCTSVLCSSATTSRVPLSSGAKHLKLSRCKHQKAGRVHPLKYFGQISLIQRAFRH